MGVELNRGGVGECMAIYGERYQQMASQEIASFLCRQGRLLKWTAPNTGSLRNAPSNGIEDWLPYLRTDSQHISATHEPEVNATKPSLNLAKAHWSGEGGTSKILCGQSCAFPWEAALFRGVKSIQELLGRKVILSWRVSEYTFIGPSP